MTETTRNQTKIEAHIQAALGFEDEDTQSRILRLLEMTTQIPGLPTSIKDFSPIIVSGNPGYIAFTYKPGGDAPQVDIDISKTEPTVSITRHIGDWSTQVYIEQDGELVPLW